MTRRLKSHKDSRFSVTGERLNTIIERDIALALLIMLSGLLFRDNAGLRGFPAGWLYSGNDPNLHSRPELFFASLAFSVIIVIIGEAAAFLIRKAAEPNAMSDMGSQYTAYQEPVYANTYDDSYSVNRTESEHPAAGITGRVKSAAEARAEKIPATVKAVQTLGKKVNTASGGRSSGSGESALKIVLIVFAALTLIVISMAASVFTSDNNPGYEFEEEDSNAFYSNSMFMQQQCDAAFDLLMNNDAAALKELGGGSPEKLLGMTDWEYSSYTEDSRALTVSGTDYAFIRFYVETGDGSEYMVAFRFEGSDLADNESTAKLTGIAACPYDVWYEYDSVTDSDAFKQEVNRRMEYAGNIEYADENILTW